MTGGVAAFKAPIVVRECQRAGHDVYVAATRASLDFVGRSTWEGITSRPVAVEIAGEGRAEHVELARVADLIIIVPATANTLARLAGGFADDMVSLTVLASRAPVVDVQPDEKPLAVSLREINEGLLSLEANPEA